MRKQRLAQLAVADPERDEAFDTEMAELTSGRRPRDVVGDLVVPGSPAHRDRDRSHPIGGIVVAQVEDGRPEGHDDRLERAPVGEDLVVGHALVVEEPHRRLERGTVEHPRARPDRVDECRPRVEALLRELGLASRLREAAREHRMIGRSLSSPRGVDAPRAQPAAHAFRGRRLAGTRQPVDEHQSGQPISHGLQSSRWRMFAT